MIILDATPAYFCRLDADALTKDLVDNSESGNMEQDKNNHTNSEAGLTDNVAMPTSEGISYPLCCYSIQLSPSESLALILQLFPSAFSGTQPLAVNR